MEDKNKIDKETADILREGQKIADFIRGDEWAIVKGKFMKKVVELADIMTIDSKDPHILMAEMAARQMAMTILLEVIKDIEGDANAHEHNKEILNRNSEEHYLQFLD